MPDLVKLLADGADTMLGLAEAGIDALMGALATGADGAVSGLAAPWTIPLVSDLYSQLTDGAELSTLDVFCLIVAIPTTIAYKATQGASPFADDTSVQAVKAAFPIPGATAPANPASDAIDAAAATAATGTTAPDGVTTTIHLVSAIAAQVAEGLCLGSGGVVDFMTAEANAIGEDPPLAGIDWVVIGLEWLSTATRGVAMMTDPNDGGEWSGGTAAGLRKWVWAASIGICVADLGVALAGKLLPSEQNRRLLRRSWGDGGPIFISCWGLAKAIAYSVAWGFDKQEHPNDVIWVRNLAYVLGTLPDLLKFMIGPTVAKKMKTVDGVSIAAIAIAGTDAVFGSTSIVLASLDESGLFEVNKSASEADSQPA